MIIHVQDGIHAADGIAPLLLRQIVHNFDAAGKLKQAAVAMTPFTLQKDHGSNNAFSVMIFLCQWFVFGG